MPVLNRLTPYSCRSIRKINFDGKFGEMKKMINFHQPKD